MISKTNRWHHSVLYIFLKSYKFYERIARLDKNRNKRMHFSLLTRKSITTCSGFGTFQELHKIISDELIDIYWISMTVDDTECQWSYCKFYVLYLLIEINHEQKNKEEIRRVLAIAIRFRRAFVNIRLIRIRVNIISVFFISV